VAGGVALNLLLTGERRSRDIDLFHDTAEAVAATVQEDARLLREAGYAVRFVRESPTFAEAVIEHEGDSTLIQWVQDSAYRFFPLVENEDLGLTLHEFDLATNKALAMAGRLEPRDWIDLMVCHRRVQPLGYLVWAACGKDPGFGPTALLQEIRRASRYSQAELDTLDFDGSPPDAAALGAEWHEMLRSAEAISEALPEEHAGTCVHRSHGELCDLTADALPEALASGELRFHSGTIGGAWPRFPRT
jgi:hypothetical protein